MSKGNARVCELTWLKKPCSKNWARLVLQGVPGHHVAGLGEHRAEMAAPGTIWSISGLTVVDRRTSRWPDPIGEHARIVEIWPSMMSCHCAMTPRECNSLVRPRGSSSDTRSTVGDMDSIRRREMASHGYDHGPDAPPLTRALAQIASSLAAEGSGVAEAERDGT